MALQSQSLPRIQGEGWAGQQVCESRLGEAGGGVRTGGGTGVREAGSHTEVGPSSQLRGLVLRPLPPGWENRIPEVTLGPLGPDVSPPL